MDAPDKQAEVEELKKDEDVRRALEQTAGDKEPQKSVVVETKQNVFAREQPRPFLVKRAGRWHSYDQLGRVVFLGSGVQ